MSNDLHRGAKRHGHSSTMIPPPELIKQLDEQTQAWTDAAARGETGWVCADCGASFSKGMPDECAYGHQRCTEILRRDKAAAVKP